MGVTVKQRPHLAVAALFAAVTLTPMAVRAEDGTPGETEAPYSPWTGREPYRSAETRPARERPPPPRVAPPERGRRPIELGTGFGVGLPHCTGDTSSAQCASLGGGFVADLAGLYRVTPYFACGAALGLGAFDGGRRLAGKVVGTGSLFLGVLGRVYFTDEGTFDPYFELSLGGGTLRTSGREPQSSVLIEDASAGPAARVGAGLDLWLGSLRFGPALDWTAYVAGTTRRCSAGGTCLERAMDGRHPHPNGFLSLTLRLSLALGAPM
jgi:hypothetical protein